MESESKKALVHVATEHNDFAGFAKSFVEKVIRHHMAT